MLGTSSEASHRPAAVINIRTRKPGSVDLPDP
jgi:hypothetical protein